DARPRALLHPPRRTPPPAPVQGVVKGASPVRSAEGVGAASSPPLDPRVLCACRSLSVALGGSVRGLARFAKPPASRAQCAAPETGIGGRLFDPENSRPIGG